MKIAIVSGSSRANSQSLKIAHWVERKLRSTGVEPVLLDLHAIKLPLDVNLDVTDIAEEPRAAKAWLPVAQMIEDVDGFAVVAPEWDGMTSPALLNFFIYAAANKSKPLAHKPIQLFTVSSVQGGHYPVALLRAFGAKNNHHVYIPGYVVIRDCYKVFNSDLPEQGNVSDKYLQERVGYGLKLLLAYSEALANMRRAAKVDLLTYPNGM